VEVEVDYRSPQRQFLHHCQGYHLAVRSGLLLKTILGGVFITCRVASVIGVILEKSQLTGMLWLRARMDDLSYSSLDEVASKVGINIGNLFRYSSLELLQVWRCLRIYVGCWTLAQRNQ